MGELMVLLYEHFLAIHQCSDAASVMAADVINDLLADEQEETPSPVRTEGREGSHCTLH